MDTLIQNTIKFPVEVEWDGEKIARYKETTGKHKEGDKIIKRGSFNSAITDYLEKLTQYFDK